MFSYYGAKTKIVDRYPEPRHDKVIEPFAGSARYALRYWGRKVVLYETFPKVIAVWRYLIEASAGDILAMPDVEIGMDLRDFKHLTDAQRWLMGYQLQRGNARPGNIVNKRCRWNQDKLRIAENVNKVKHWELRAVDCFSEPWDEDATYFIDPPYMVQKHGYNHGTVDYPEIARRVEEGKGQFIVCGNSDDDWLPFTPLGEMHGTCKTHKEMVYLK